MRQLLLGLAFLGGAASGSVVLAEQAAFSRDQAADDFVRANLIWVFYHEVGHALIDVLNLPVLGPEESSADTFAALMIDGLWEETAAVEIAVNTARGFELYDADYKNRGFETSAWDTHGLEMQRYYHLACLIYGADPVGRDHLIVDLQLPDDRAGFCADEFLLASDGWRNALQSMTDTNHTKGLRLIGASPNDPTAVTIEAEIANLNQLYRLPEWIEVRIEPCGEPNAFYYEDSRSVTICTEYADDMLRVYKESLK